MKDPYEHIHMATNERLAEMIEAECLPDTELTVIGTELVKEAAARLRERHKEPFNHEAFSL